MFIRLFKEIYNILDPKDRRNGSLLLFLMFMTATIDAAGVVSLMPFIAIISQPDLIFSNNYLLSLYNIFLSIGGSGQKGFLIFLGGLCFVLLLSSSCLKILTMYLQVRFAYMGERNIGQRILSGFLFQSYSEYLNQQSSELGQTILSEVRQFVAQLLEKEDYICTNISDGFDGWKSSDLPCCDMSNNK